MNAADGEIAPPPHPSRAPGAVELALDALFRGLMLSVGLVVVATVAVISWGVLAREVLHHSDVWVTESTTYLMGYMTFVGGAALAWQGRHLRVDVLAHWLGPRGRRAIDALSTLVVAAVAAIFLRLSWAFWADAWDSGEKSWGMLSLPLWIPYLGMLAGSALLALVQLVRLVQVLAGRAPADAAPAAKGH